MQTAFAWDDGLPQQHPGLQEWAPENWVVAPDWVATVEGFLAGSQGQRLASFVRQRLAQGAVVFPPRPLTALALTPRHRVRVVILGQDPYHGLGQAEGLAFSVAEGQKCPPSLRNIFKELAREMAAGELPCAGGAAHRSVSLRAWATQGVLLLNTCLTVEEGRPASHSGQGWESLTEQLVKEVAAAERPVAFLLWGAHAQRFSALIESAGGARHLLLCANHPSPLSANRAPTPFLGCGHFADVNRFLSAQGEVPIAW